MNLKLPHPVKDADDLAEMMREARVKYRHLFDLAAFGDRNAHRELTGLYALLVYLGGGGHCELTREEAMDFFGAIWDAGAGNIPAEKAPAQGRGSQWRH